MLAGVVAASAAVVIVQEQANARLRDQIENLRREIAHTSASLAKEKQKVRESQARNEYLLQVKTQPPSNDFTHSKAYKKMELRFQGQLADNYGALFRKLKLSPDNLALVEKLLVQKQLIETAIAHDFAAGQLKGLDPNDLDALKALTAVGTEDVDSQIRQILGDTSYDQYEHYSATLNSRQQVNTFAAQIKYTNQPLNDDQTDQLTELLAKTDSDPTKPLPDSFQAQAAAILNPSQLPALKTLTAVLQAHRTIQAMNQAALAKGIVPPTALTGADLLFNLQK